MWQCYDTDGLPIPRETDTVAAMLIQEIGQGFATCGIAAADAAAALARMGEAMNVIPYTYERDNGYVGGGGAGVWVSVVTSPVTSPATLPPPAPAPAPTPSPLLHPTRAMRIRD